MKHDRDHPKLTLILKSEELGSASLSELLCLGCLPMSATSKNAAPTVLDPVRSLVLAGEKSCSPSFQGRRLMRGMAREEQGTSGLRADWRRKLRGASSWMLSPLSQWTRARLARRTSTSWCGLSLPGLGSPWS